MKSIKKIAVACAIAASFVAGSAAAGPVTLDFEGIGEFAAIADYYNGGAAADGARGPNYGISFSSDSVVLIDSEAGGSGTIGGMPSGVAVATFFDGGAAIMNVAAGFDTRLAFHYAAGEPAFVNVFDDLGGAGNLLASLDLGVNVAHCMDGNNLFCQFSLVELLFSGTARSVVFGGPNAWLTVDDVTIGIADSEPPAEVPEPATLALAALGLAGLAASRRGAGRAGKRR